VNCDNKWQAYGVHMNGYVQIDGEKHLWVAKRSSDRQNFPGAFDHIVAGGQVRSFPFIEGVMQGCLCIYLVGVPLVWYFASI